MQVVVSIRVTYVNKDEMEQSGWENGEGRRLLSNCLCGFILSELGSKKRRHISVSSWPVKVSFSSSSCLLKWSYLHALGIELTALTGMWHDTIGCTYHKLYLFPPKWQVGHMYWVWIDVISPTPSIPPTPIHASTPRRQTKPSKRTNKADEHLRVFNVNFKSVKTKQRWCWTI
jgi:hypothetical protein